MRRFFKWLIGNEMERLDRIEAKADEVIALLKQIRELSA